MDLGGSHVQNEKKCLTLPLFKQNKKSYLPLEIIGRKWFLFFFDEPFIFPEIKKNVDFQNVISRIFWKWKF